VKGKEKRAMVRIVRGTQDAINQQLPKHECAVSLEISEGKPGGLMVIQEVENEGG